ncbi:hypothetical protein RhiirA5_99581 [Rhizophagus irregularis]|uniref:Uncharacterized protein n=2 Tax=Rhizophagus irregularis TaxID=588596 RepID=U9USR8_RHIID|nr:hypothetical protein GLOIN_2v1733782 [Rhizophagus irregularis DAOM 181602=DAOM 197198]PKB98576.1 hypothetical protein RhiirA5_99581 [Rhizophagus irregularis]PKC68912.1 hypothetical protein RhiirA1_136883 [Rhizophagus irregularis]PKY32468.1 hypothetical protein RhiirB3_112163 [Rhizophagus irregularis]POG58088.1 hypothetical protein GLOIN_2v1733782 [Rhizophagus irregularis DAOM 181602=DAOM 197198]GBC43749.2 hypothetical protein GLOIN_2v1733782 [Rhizophagus irregularis DAOM 181602=DAOM 197198]|eukprot:XP_025164954.1 hypothetical protein GLOIN_2v1733782 [Rhizophagus irregularis DAOM 181602=DAOM 197198]
MSTFHNLSLSVAKLSNSYAFSFLIAFLSLFTVTFSRLFPKTTLKTFHKGFRNNSAFIGDIWARIKKCVTFRSEKKCFYVAQALHHYT